MAVRFHENRSSAFFVIHYRIKIAILKKGLTVDKI
jgi:hypothetical protein